MATITRVEARPASRVVPLDEVAVASDAYSDRRVTVAYMPRLGGRREFLVQAETGPPRTPEELRGPRSVCALTHVELDEWIEALIQLRDSWTTK
jgi:hypothetical protein